MQWGWGGRSREALLLVALLEQAGIWRIWYRERHGDVCVGGAGVCTVVSLGILTSRKRVHQKIDQGSLGTSNAKTGQARSWVFR